MALEILMVPKLARSLAWCLVVALGLSKKNLKAVLIAIRTVGQSKTIQ